MKSEKSRRAHYLNSEQHPTHTLAYPHAALSVFQSEGVLFHVLILIRHCQSSVNIRLNSVHKLEISEVPELRATDGFQIFSFTHCINCPTLSLEQLTN